MQMGIHEAASDAAYELLAALCAIGPEDDLEPADEACAAALADAAAHAGLNAAAVAMLSVIEGAPA